jgi:hypothetical protein
MKQYPYRNTEPSLLLTIYRCVWLLVVVTFIIAACAWADKDMHGTPPEHEESGNRMVPLEK